MFKLIEFINQIIWGTRTESASGSDTIIWGG
jgi:hypothetical protein